MTRTLKHHHAPNRSARLTATLLTVLLLFAACRGDDNANATVPPPPEVPLGPTPSSTPEVRPDTIRQVMPEDLAVARQPGEVVRIDGENVIAVSVDRPEETYSVERQPEPSLTVNGDVVAVAPAGVSTLLARFAPLEAQEVVPDASQAEIRELATHRIIFHFDDGTAQDVSFVEQSGQAYVVSGVDGPVYRMPAGRLNDLVPPASAMR